jgi:hypothetical protein
MRLPMVMHADPSNVTRLTARANTPATATTAPERFWLGKGVDDVTEELFGLLLG